MKKSRCIRASGAFALQERRASWDVAEENEVAVRISWFRGGGRIKWLSISCSWVVDPREDKQMAVAEARVVGEDAARA